MFQLPIDIQCLIFSYDSTYRNIWKNVLDQFKKCNYCLFNKRVEIGWEWTNSTEQIEFQLLQP